MLDWRHLCKYRFVAANRIFVAAILMASTFAWGQEPDRTYSDLAKKAAGGDTSIDFRALRLACAKAAQCDAKGSSETRIAMRRAGQARDYNEAVKLAEKLISSGFPNIEAHSVCAGAYRALNQPEKADFHREVTTALIRSILKTGDGKTKETAFEVIGTQEEQLILAVLGLQIRSQALVSGKPHSYDVLEAEDLKSGQKVKVYFNIDAFYPMKGL